MEGNSADKRIWTMVSEDGKHAAAGMSLEPAGTKPGGGGEEQPYDGHGRYLGTAGSEGISGGNEVRGKVTTPKKPPAHVVWKHTEEQQGLKPQMQDVLEDARKAEDLDSLTISSGRRQPVIPGDPHADGRAVDVSRINGVAVKNLGTASGPEGEKARSAAANLEEKLKNNPDVNQIIGPSGGWNRDGELPKAKFTPITDKTLLNEHKDHYHINVRRK